MNTITRYDIRDHYVIPSLTTYREDYDVEGILDDLFKAYPLDEWTYAIGRYDHPTGCPTYWDIVAEHDISAR